MSDPTSIVQDALAQSHADDACSIRHSPDSR